MVVTVSERQKVEILRPQYSREGMCQILWRRRCPVRVGDLIHLTTARGRAQRRFARVLITRVRTEFLFRITDRMARHNGHPDKAALVEWWKSVHGAWDPSEVVGVASFVLVAGRREDGRWTDYLARSGEGRDSDAGRGTVGEGGGIGRVGQDPERRL